MATIDVKALKKGVRAALKHMSDHPGEPAPGAGVDYSRVLAASGMIADIFKRELQAHVLREVRKTFGGREPVPGCLKASDGPFTAVGKGVQGSTWLTKDRKRLFKVGKVGLREEHGITRKFEEARTEFAISQAAGDLGFGPKVHETYFCCDEHQNECYYVILMDYAPGKSLWEWHRKASAPKREAMRKEVLDVVRRLNDAGIEHADLHAENIIVSADTGRPIIIDYGMASWSRAERVKDELSINRFFSDTTTLQDATEYAAAFLIHTGVINTK